MAGNKIAFKWNILYLGVTIVAHITWTSHLTTVQEKAFKVLQQMNRLTASNWGLKPKICKMLYAIVAERITWYAAPTWCNGKRVVVNKLFIIQKGLLLCVIKCYPTVSSNALHVFQGYVPSIYVQSWEVTSLPSSIGIISLTELEWISSQSISGGPLPEAKTFDGSSGLWTSLRGPRVHTTQTDLSKKTTPSVVHFLLSQRDRP